MKRIFAFATLAAAFCTALAETNVGIAYARDTAGPSDHLTTAAFNFWVAGTENGLQFGHFSFIDSGNGPGSFATFKGHKLLSFKGYTHPYFNKVVDFWVEGFFDQDSATGSHGRLTRLHMVINESDRAGKTFNFALVEVYLPGGTTPIFTRFTIPFNRINIILADDAGLANGASLPGTRGFIYGAINGFTDNESNFIAENYKMVYQLADNYLFSFDYVNPRAAFHGTRIRSFSCTNTGLFGKNADVWLDGKVGDKLSTANTNAVAHVILTDSAGPWLQYGYIAIYHPSNLTTPLHRRVLFVSAGHNNILCK